MTTAARTLAEIDALLSFLAAVEADAAARATATATVAAPATPAANDTAPAAASLRFLWNGIKGADGKLQPAHISYRAPFAGYTTPDGRRIQPPRPAGIGVSHRDHCGHFGDDVWAVFAVENNTDSQTDYFDRDRFDVEIGHPLFAAVAAACVAALEHDAKIADKRAARRGYSNGDGYRAQAAEVRALIAKAAQLN